MKITLIVTGKTDAAWLQEGIELYIKRLKHYIPFTLKVLPDIRNTRNISPGQQKEKEAAQMLPHIETAGEVYLLDEGGEQFSSRELSAFIEKKMVTACRELIFVIGGPFGFSQELEKVASGKISLSRLTFSHQMVRLLFAEQLYRAMTIIKGESYHND
jgi:23S rRNA (pseudouridine1915-N3)-methyltransferase